MKERFERSAGKSKSWMFNRYFIVVILISFFAGVIMQMFNATISLHIVSMGYQPSLAGQIASIGAFIAFLYRIFGGKLSDWYGRRVLLLLGFPIYAVASLLCGITTVIPLLFVYRILQMVGFAMTTTTVSIAVVDIIPKDKLGVGIGIFGMSLSLSTAVGPSVALFLNNTAGAFYAVMLGACLCGIAGLLLSVFVFGYERDAKFYGNRIENLKQKSRKMQHSSHKGLWGFIEKKAIPGAMVNFFLTSIACLFGLYLTLYATREGIAYVGMFFTFSVITMIAARAISSRMMQRLGIAITVIIGSILFIMSLILLVLSKNMHILFYLAGASYGLGNGIANSTLNTASVEAAAPDRKGVASSTFMLPIDVSVMVASAFWGKLVDVISFSFIFFVAIGICFIAIIMTILFFGRKNPNRSITMEQPPVQL